MNTTNKIIDQKWFDNTGLLIVFFIFFPPVGIYGITKRKTSTLKKLLYIFPASIYTIFLFILVLGIIISIVNPKEYYKDGLENYNNKRYFLAISDFEKVRITDVNYKDAQIKIRASKDSINKENIEHKIELQSENEKTIENKQLLTSFQRSWADSIVKSWKGDFIISHKLSLPDTIQFELSKNATKSFNSNVQQTLPMYISNYNSSAYKKIGTEYMNYKTTIEFIPNKELTKGVNDSEWSRPIILSTGLKIYSGNKYYKEYVGSLQCKFKDTSDGNTYYVVLKNNGSENHIREYKFKSEYWVKNQDIEKNQGIGLSKCF